ncbi:ABC transporter ATP-binding protein [Hymenobacter psychrophilus]|nr:ABC transporter ATP-binding protein [Hymenobacter psychrophilus]
MSSGVIRRSLDSIRYYLTKPQKRKTVWLTLLTLFASFIDVVGLASLVPVMIVAAEPGAIGKSKYFGPIYRGLGFESEPRFLLSLMGALLIFFLVKNLFSVWVNYVQVRFTTEVAVSIVKTQLNKYLHLPFWHFNDSGSASLINGALNVPQVYVNGVMRPLLVFLSESVIVLVILFGILFYKPLLLGLLILVMAPTALLTYRLLRSRAQQIGDRVNQLRPISYSIIGDLFTGFAELKLAGKQQRFRDRLVDNQTEVMELEAQGYVYSLLPVRIIEMVAIIGVLTIFLYAVFIPSSSGNLIALVGLFAAAAYRLMPSINRMLTSLVQIKQSQFTIENLAAYREDKYKEEPHPEQLPLAFTQNIVFNQLAFTFPGEARPTLQDISLTIKKGEKIGFVGSSGSGKTTLMNILLRFYTEQEGNILIDGQPLTPKNLSGWHRLIGYVKQDTFLMEASIADNISLGDTEVDAERMRYAIEQASLAGFVNSLPNGLATHIGERGSKLSGGQRQRVGIARALYKRTEVLVLDEATSALDSETEREVSEAIRKLATTDMTILIIAHRITTLRECDRIYELSEGKIVAQHTYENLLQKAI